MSQLSEKSDEELANLSQKGDLYAFNLLANKYWHRIHRFLLAMFDHATAADVTEGVVGTVVSEVDKQTDELQDKPEEE